MQIPSFGPRTTNDVFKGTCCVPLKSILCTPGTLELGRATTQNHRIVQLNEKVDRNV